MHWLEPFIIAEVKELGVFKLAQLDGFQVLGWVNGAHLKPFHGSIISTSK